MKDHVIPETKRALFKGMEDDTSQSNISESDSPEENDKYQPKKRILKENDKLIQMISEDCGIKDKTRSELQRMITKPTGF